MESLNVRFRGPPAAAVTSRTSRLYLVMRTRSGTGTKVTGRAAGWKSALNTLALFYGDRITFNGN